MVFFFQPNFGIKVKTPPSERPPVVLLKPSPDGGPRVKDKGSTSKSQCFDTENSNCSIDQGRF